MSFRNPFPISPSVFFRFRIGNLFHRISLILGLRNTVFLYSSAILFWLCLLYYPAMTATFEFLLFDFTQNVVAKFRAPHPSLLIGAIDTETLHKAKSRWPWKRAEMGNLIDRIAEGKPKLILVDILFQQPDEGDEILERAIKNAGNVALISLVEENLTGNVRKVQRYSSLKEFRKVAKVDGFVWSIIDSDGTTRRFVARDSRLDQDSCVLQIAKTVTSETIRLSADSDGLTKQLTAFPLYHGGIPQFRVSEFLQKTIPVDVVKDKIVLLGVTAAIVHDYHHTPIGMLPGVEILGVNLDSLIQNRSASVCDGWLYRFFLGIAGFIIGLHLMSKPESLSFPFSLITGSLVTLGGMGVSLLLGVFFPWAFFACSWFYSSAIWLFSRIFHDFMTMQMMEAEAKATGRIQALYFPQKAWKSDTGYSCQGVCFPCDEVGGDYFDYFPQEADKLVFIIGDVSGHGFPAAMITTIAKTIALDLHLKKELSPEILLKSTNAVIRELLQRKRLMTAICGVLDSVSHTIDIAFAGQGPAYQVSYDGEVQEISQVLYPLGARKILNVKTIRTQLEPGGRIILYTDGITEAMNWREEMFGYKLLAESLKRHVQAETPEKFIQLVLADTKAFCEGRGFNDDVTMLVISRAKGSPEQSN